MSAVSTEVVPFTQMQRMATAVVKSKMFGVETEEQALSLMMLAQAEGIHPMTAIRDYHIIKGRPSLKGDTMLARFQAAGGIVEWISLSDEKVEADFHHPKYSPKRVRIDWDKARAERAGLWGKDNWRFYPRAMLRNRVVSEGVKATLPGIAQGVYTPEEMLHMDATTLEPINVEAAVDSFARPGVPQEQVAGLMRAISEAPDANALKAAYAEAHKIALDAKDEQRIGSFAIAYDARKAELAQPVAQS